MKQTPSVFLSYSRRDSARARALEAALKARKVPVWRDVRSIAAGERWSDAIEQGIRESRGVAVLITAASAASEWVTYEYALATGAQVPVVAVRVRKAMVPSPIRRFQIVEYSDARSVAKSIDQGILAQSRAAGRKRASTPTLVARFQEVNGEIALASGGKIPQIWMELWMEQVPSQTRTVAFEILDLGFRDRKWTVRRRKQGANSLREFLTDDMNSYGDVEIWARGVGRGPANWAINSRLYEALLRYYRSRPKNAEVRRALKQIREN
jgi:hypothetical protein